VNIWLWRNKAENIIWQYVWRFIQNENLFKMRISTHLVVKMCLLKTYLEKDELYILRRKLEDIKRNHYYGNF
jgi:hypothetical protein